MTVFETEEQKAERLKAAQKAYISLCIVRRATEIEMMLMNHSIPDDKITLSALRVVMANLEMVQKIGVEKIIAAAEKKDEAQFTEYVKKIYDDTKQQLEMIVDAHLNLLTKN